MSSTPWLWRALSAGAGTCLYPWMAPTNWRNPYLMLYDVPTLMLAYGFLGANLGAILREGAAQAGLRLALLLSAAVVAAGARFRDWPVSGHLTVALTVGIMEAGDVGNPGWLRRAALAPALILILIRTFRPQSELMGTHTNTLAALVVGSCLGALGLLLGRR